MAESRDSKLRKLNAFRRKRPHMSASALASTLEGVRDDGLPDLVSRHNLRESRDVICAEKTRYGDLVHELNLPKRDGGEAKISIASPFAFLWIALTASAALATVFEAGLDLHPSSPEAPWNLVLYSDEVTPGSALSPNNERKFQGVYYTFLELGAHALSREESWFPLVTEYSKLVNTLEGSMSKLWGSLVKFMFNPNGHNFETAGMTLPSGRRLWAKLGVFLQDGAAHSMTWSSRTGQSRLCLLCKNVFTDESEIAAADGTALLRCNAVREDQLVDADNNDLRRSARFLESKFADPIMGVTKFNKLQQALGITHVPGSVLLDRSLDHLIKPVDQYMHDWMHTLFADGIVNLLVYLLFEAHIEADRRLLGAYVD